MGAQPQVFRWLQPPAVTVHEYEGFDPEVLRPVLAVQEEGSADPWVVRILFLIANDAGDIRRVSMDQIKVREVGTWTALTALLQRNSQEARAGRAGLLVPQPQVNPARLREG